MIFNKPKEEPQKQDLLKIYQINIFESNDTKALFIQTSRGIYELPWKVASILSISQESRINGWSVIHSVNILVQSKGDKTKEYEIPCDVNEKQLIIKKLIEIYDMKLIDSEQTSVTIPGANR